MIKEFCSSIIDKCQNEPVKFYRYRTPTYFDGVYFYFLQGKCEKHAFSFLIMDELDIIEITKEEWTTLKVMECF